jgi:primosomal protein N' (replication factor Y) (superfamily II helicase)
MAGTLQLAGRVGRGQVCAMRAAILFPMPLPEAFDYAVPDGMVLEPGSYVIAPLGPNQRLGVVWAISEKDSGNLKTVLQVLPAPPMPEALRRFVDWSARYLVQPPGQLLAMVLRSREALEEGPLETLVQATGEVPPRLTPERARVLAAAGAPLPRQGLAQAAGVSSGVIAGLVRSGALGEVRQPVDKPFEAPDPCLPSRPLSEDQSAARQIVAEGFRTGGYTPFLLEGVTGSGKTEVYLEAIADVLAAEPDAQVLVLLPEIALTQAVMARLQTRFGAAPAQWHSDVPPPERRRVWREIAHGRARIVVGARSALFLPFARLRLIVVDEEHDPSFKQDEGLRYHARDLAVSRARLEGASIVLASATPSLETRNNARSGRYRHILLPSRFGAARLPDVQLIDLKTHRPEPDTWLSPPLVEAMGQTLGRGEQCLLFLNRRGYAPVVLCRTCGLRMKAPDTDSWLVEHRYSGRLVCHLTGYSIPKPDRCPQCGTIGGLTSVGPGVERVLAEARARFPGARVDILSSDTAQSPAQVRAVVQRMEAGEIDILVGTQIVAKGHNFPRLTLVGVVDADLGLKGGDPRAGERTFQLLSQVAGRAGRADLPGQALIQTHYPENEALQALAHGDVEGFLAAETAARADAGIAPFGRMAALHLMAQTTEAVDSAARMAGDALIPAEGVEVWGPAPPPLALIRGWHRRRFLVRADKSVDISAYMAAWRAAWRLPGAVRAVVDIEPYSFL